MDTRLERIEKWLKGEKAQPWHMQLQPTEKCNLKCRFCWSSVYKRDGKELSDKKWEEITEEACKMGVKELTIVGGGEPLTRIELIKSMATVIKKFDVKGNLITNGSLITSSFAEHLVKIGWDCIAISIDGATPETDNWLRGPNAFQRTMNSISLINEWKKKFNSEEPPMVLPNIIFHSLITRQNVHEIADLLPLAKNVKATTLVIKSVNDDLQNPKFFIERDQFDLLCSQLEKIKKLSKELWINLDWQINIDDIKRILFGKGQWDGSIKQEKVKTIPCSRPFCEMVIIPDGTVGPCCAFCEGKYSDRMPLDDIPPEILQYKKIFFKKLKESVSEFVDDITYKSLQEVWNGEKFNNFRELVKKEEVPYFCKKTCPLDYIYLEESGKIAKK